MADSKLFQPLKLGRVQLQHRVVMAPLTRLRVDTNHVPMPMMVEHYSQRACVPGTLLIGEATSVSETHAGGAVMPGIWTQAQMDGWKPVVDAVHARGCHMFLQLWAPGRAAQPGFPNLSASAVPMDADATVPREITEEEIHATIADFAQAARNAVAVGFDGIELHGANGYLIDQFLQDVSNRRTDGWGGSAEKRSRFAVEVARAAVDAVGPDRVGLRLSPWSDFQGMKMASVSAVREQYAHTVNALKPLNLAYLHIVESRVTNSVTVEKTEGVEFMLEAWANQSPVLVAGGFDLASAKKAVDEEYASFDTAVVFGRYFVSTPDLVFRLKHGLAPNQYDRATFYAVGQERGYNDYPFSKEFLEQQAKV